jgi:3-keto-disaccharide hydrolase
VSTIGGWLAVALVFVTTGGATAQVQAPAADAEGWVALFDGKTLAGWQTVQDAKWTVADGAASTTGEKPGWLMTTGEWGDFELHVEFQAPATTNSGVFLRSAVPPTDPTKDCYELNIAPPENPFPTGSLVGREKSAGIIGINRPLMRLFEPKPLKVWDGKWHSFDVTASGGKFYIYCDENLVLEYQDPSPIGRGHVGLQAKEGPVAFRNVRLRPLVAGAAQ